MTNLRAAIEHRDRARAEVQSLADQATALRAQIAADSRVLADVKKEARTYVKRRDALERQVQDATHQLDNLRREIDGISERAHQERMRALWIGERCQMGAVA